VPLHASNSGRQNASQVQKDHQSILGRSPQDFKRLSRGQPAGGIRNKADRP
jgi:hypothetical protein